MNPWRKLTCGNSHSELEDHHAING
jgi:hypothetical protein